MFDYTTLQMIWWALLGFLLIGFAVSDGFDMGVGTLLPFLGRSDVERRLMLNSIGPTWEGNQTWLITAAGATFAAWPLVYAVAFSSFYFALLLTLFALFFRPVGFDYRSKLTNPLWRNAWDWGLFSGSFVPALIFGVAFGNLFLGVPFQLASDMRVSSEGGLLGYLKPFALLCGAVSVLMCCLHGAVFLQLKTEGEIAERARRTTPWLAAGLFLTFAAGGVWLTGMTGHRIAVMPETLDVIAPLQKTVAIEKGGWLANYRDYPWMTLAPLSGFLGVALTPYFAARRRPTHAFVASAAAITGVILTAGFSLFPFIVPSSLNPASGLTVWDASSSRKTLFIMLWIMIFIFPVVLAYTAWVYRALRGRINTAHIIEKSHTVY
ncbi:MAG: cytochrome d ubiquinol oxidase subunit II [Chromatiales bacterium]